MFAGRNLEKSSGSRQLFLLFQGIWGLGFKGVEFIKVVFLVWGLGLRA